MSFIFFIARIISVHFLVTSLLQAGPPDPYTVAIVYNSTSRESGDLAQVYAKARGIPLDNLIGLEIPNQPVISRSQYESMLRDPLRREFDVRLWWTRSRDPKGVVVPTSNDIRILTIMKGIPLRIEDAAADGPEHLHLRNRGASVDSELALLGVEGLTTKGPLNNPYYKSERSIWNITIPDMMLVSRLDAAAFHTCKSMIFDALEAETNGLRGLTFIDHANKYPTADAWLREISRINTSLNLPTTEEKTEDTFAKSTVMKDAIFYYGWYDPHVSGPFLRSDFRFRKGAVAIHIHSFSACQLTDVGKNWSAALLAKGAAATVGNVDEPLLGLTHNVDVLHDRLLKGFTWAEASSMASPSLSWQSVALGDPLYQPFRNQQVTQR